MRRALVLLTVLMGWACGDSDRDAPPVASAPPEVTPQDPASPTSASRSVESMLAEVGDGVPFAVVIRPRHWASIRKQLQSLAGGSEMPASMPPWISNDDPTAAIEALASGMGQRVQGLAGLDLQRPIVAGLGEPADLEPLALPSVGDDGSTARSLGLRHVVFVPVADGKAFIDSLPAALGPGTKTLPTWVEAESSWTGHVGNSTFVTASVQGNYARVVMFVDVLGVTPEQAEQALRPRVAVQPQPPAATPAVRELLDDKTALGLQLRTWRMRSFAAYSGYRSLVPALESVEGELRGPLLARGIALVLQSESLMTDEGAEVDDWGFSLRATEEQLELAAVGSLTPTGQRLLDTARTDIAVLPTKSAETTLDGFVRLDLRKAYEAVELPAQLTTIPRREMLFGFRQCGPICLAHVVARSPVRALALAHVAMAGANEPVPAAAAIQATLTQLDPPQGAAAVIVKDPQEVEVARAWLKMMLDGLPLPASTTTARGDETVLQLDLGTDPTAVFEGTTAETPALAEASVRLSAIEPSVGDVRVRFDLQRQGPALLARLAARRGADPTLAYALGTDKTAWDSPISSLSAALDATCIAEVSRALGAVLETREIAAADQRASVLATALAEVEPKCPAGSPLAQRRAQQLDKLIDVMFAPPPAGNVPVSSSDETLMPGKRVVAGRGSLTLEGRALNPESEDSFNEELRDALEAAAVVDKAKAEEAGEEFEGRVVMELAPDLPFSRAMDILWSAWQADWRAFQIVVRNDAGAKAGIHVSTPNWGAGDPGRARAEVRVSAKAIVATARGKAAVKLGVDYAALQTWAKRQRPDEDRTVLIRIERDVTIQSLVSVLDALRGTQCARLWAMAPGEVPEDCYFYQPILEIDPPYAG